MNDGKRLIEVAFPLKEVSLDSVKERYVSHGHISTLHTWPARRPLAASRAVLIATLLPDPGTPEGRKAIMKQLAGHIIEKTVRKKQGIRIVEKTKEETEGGILRWKREGGPALDQFRQEIRRAFGGQAPKVLDPFAGGGAIPLEAMRLGCDVTAGDLNPVAWFILKCVLEYPQNLVGQTYQLPHFVLSERKFMEGYLKTKAFKGAKLRAALQQFCHNAPSSIQPDLISCDSQVLEANLAWHVRAWGRWVLAEARRNLVPFYPIYAEFEPLVWGKEFKPRPLQLLEVNDDGTPQIDSLNAEFDDSYRNDPKNPRWIAKPTVAYLWVRTVKCKQCRAVLPLLKTRWLCKVGEKRVLLTMQPNQEKTRVVFGIQEEVSQADGNMAQRREHDKRVGAGTMTRRGATCPCCDIINTMEDIRLEGRSGRLGAVMTAVVVSGQGSKEYRLPTDHEQEVSVLSRGTLQSLFSDIPYGIPEEPTPTNSQYSGVCSYGLNTWRKLFTDRQLFCLGSFVVATRKLGQDPSQIPSSFREAVVANLALAVDRLADRSSVICTWDDRHEKCRDAFVRFALPAVWDYAEINPLSSSTGNFLSALDWVSRVVDHISDIDYLSCIPIVQHESATQISGKYDAIVTDPPYYDAIPYSDLMDFFHVWLRRTLHGLCPRIDAAFKEPLGPKWNHDKGEGELVDDASRFAGDKEASKRNYEDGMARSFRACHDALRSSGRLVVVFANKQPDAWETLVAALIRSGFTVTGSWPIQTEMGTRMRAMTSAALASSVWLVCRKRENPRPGWDSNVLGEMRDNITLRLREYWDAGIRGPDFVWTAIGPALEAFSKYPVVKRANKPGRIMTVSEFLREVRRMVVDFVVGRVLTRAGQEPVGGLDDLTTYYLLHRNDYGMDRAPVGGCILYALSCNLSDADLINRFGLLSRSGRTSFPDEGEDDDEAEEIGGNSGVEVRLKVWNRRKSRSLGIESSDGRPVPLIDQAHKLMHLWKAGDPMQVNEYLDARGLPHNRLFGQVLQALIELAREGTEERAILESLSNHMASRSAIQSSRQKELFEET